MLGEMSNGKDFLNLFAYTGSASVQVSQDLQMLSGLPPLVRIPVRRRDDIVLLPVTQVASIVASLPTFTAPMIDFPALKGVGVSPSIESMLKQIASQQSAMLDVVGHEVLATRRRLR